MSARTNDDSNPFYPPACAALPGVEVDRDLGATLNCREEEVLQLVDEGLRNRQIADRLCLAEATVKWHLGKIYEKLGVGSRTAALAKARSLGILRG